MRLPTDTNPEIRQIARELVKERQKRKEDEILDAEILEEK
jgi:hypothetical protein